LIWYRSQPRLAAVFVDLKGYGEFGIEQILSSQRWLSNHNGGDL
jgi:hypothetical protein